MINEFSSVGTALILLLLNFNSKPCSFITEKDLPSGYMFPKSLWKYLPSPYTAREEDKIIFSILWSLAVLTKFKVPD